VIVQCLRSDSSCFGHDNRSYFLRTVNVTTLRWSPGPLFAVVAAWVRSEPLSVDNQRQTDEKHYTATASQRRRPPHRVRRLDTVRFDAVRESTQMSTTTVKFCPCYTAWHRSVRSICDVPFAADDLYCTIAEFTTWFVFRYLLQSVHTWPRRERVGNWANAL